MSKYRSYPMGRNILFIATGLGDHIRPAFFLESWIKRKYLAEYKTEVYIHRPRWRAKKGTFRTKLDLFKKEIFSVITPGCSITVAGISAASSLAIGVFDEMRDVVNMAVSICGRLSEGNRKILSLKNCAYWNKSFAEGVRIAEAKIKKFTQADKSRIVTVSSKWDHLIPRQTAVVPGAINIELDFQIAGQKVPVPEHTIAIAAAMTTHRKAWLDLILPPRVPIKYRNGLTTTKSSFRGLRLHLGFSSSGDN